MTSNKNEITRIDLENGTIIELVQHPSTHAICEYCNKPVPFAMVRKVNELPCCIDCMANLADDVCMRASTTIKEELYYNLFDAGFEQAADMVFTGLTEVQQQKANIRYNRK